MSCIVTECRSIKTITSALQQYQKVNDSTFTDVKQYLTTIKTKSILNAYHHILFHHLNSTKKQNNEQFEQIYNQITQIIQCNTNNCNKLRRNQRDRDTQLNNTTDIKNETDKENMDTIINNNSEKHNQNIFQIDTLDSIHCHLLHSYDSGFRIKVSELEDEYGIHTSDYAKKIGDKKLFKDDELVDIRLLIKKQRTKIKRNFRREQRLQSTPNKFRMQYFGSKKPNTIIKASNEAKDEKKAESTDYKNEKEIELKASGNFYSFGHRYYYWSWYKNREIEDKIHNPGYLYCEWYIAQKYANLKEEILNNEISRLDVNRFSNTLMQVRLNMECDHSKRILSDNSGKKLHYKIKAREVISVQHLLAVKLYTSFDILSFNFSVTFRKQNKNETDDALKKRNSQYWNWSKLLRETVECFGQRIDKSHIKTFYHGCSYLIFPLFIAKFCGPTSTTPQIEVATIFSNDDGVILELGKYGFRSETKYFNCTWLSYYGNEDERLFFGGFKPLQVLSIRLVKNNENYYWFVKAFTFLNKAMDGKIFTFEEKANITKRNYAILDKLMAHEINEGLYGRSKFPPYVNESFHAFCGFKKQIQIDIEAMKNDHPRLGKYFMQNGFEGAVSCDYIKSLFRACKYIIICKQHGAAEIQVTTGVLKVLLAQINKINQIKYEIKLKCITMYHIQYDSKVFEKYKNKFMENGWKMIVKYSKKKKKSSVPFRNVEFRRQ